MRIYRLIILLLSMSICSSCVLSGVNDITNAAAKVLPLMMEFSQRAAEFREKNGHWPADPHEVCRPEDSTNRDLQVFSDSVTLKTIDRGLNVINKLSGQSSFVIGNESTSKSVFITSDRTP